MSAESLANPAVRAGLHKRLMRRNRIVGVLRLVVPLIGLVVLGYLIAQIVIANAVEDLGATGIHIERDRLLIDTPEYVGVTKNGTHYRVVAETASALLSRADVIELGNATLALTRPDGVSFTATADRAFYDLVSQTVDVPVSADVVDSRDTKARLYNVFVDWANQTITARDGADITFADGTNLTADTLIMYGKDNSWDMTGVVVRTTREGDGI